MIRVTPRLLRNLTSAYHAFLAAMQLFIGTALILTASDETDQALRLFTFAVAILCVLTGFALAKGAADRDVVKRVRGVE